MRAKRTIGVLPTAATMSGWMSTTGRLGTLLSPPDVVVELLDHRCQVGDHGFAPIRDRDHPDELVPIEDGEVADVAFGHQLHAIFEGCRWSDGLDLGGHDLGPGGFPRAPIHQHDLAGVVTLRDDADEFAVIYDRQGAYVLVGQKLEGVVHGSPRSYRKDVRPLRGKNVGHGLHRSTSGLDPR